MSESSGRSLALDGENIATTRWEDARHWMSVYADLIQFKLGLLDRVRRELPKLQPIAQRAAAADLVIIEHQLEGYRGRMDLWYKRLWDLQNPDFATRPSGERCPSAALFGSQSSKVGPGVGGLAVPLFGFCVLALLS